MTFKPITYTAEEHKKLILSDAKTKKEYGALNEEFNLISKLIKARKKANKTQDEVAKIMHTTKSTISRLESTSKHSPSVDTLRRYAAAVNCDLSIKLVTRKCM